MNIKPIIQLALAEDINSGDINALLVPENQQAHAKIITREAGILCGQPWFNAVFAELDPTVVIHWLAAEGEAIMPGQTLCTLAGKARSLLTGERTALNFLQTLSGTATITHQYVEKLLGTQTRLLDTRKTLPGLRDAQKYAVRIAGGKNHRQGLYDAFLIKENHIAACGSITQAVQKARELKLGEFIEVEVESLTELQEALRAKVEIILCDNFDLAQLRDAVALTAGSAKLEASGNVTLENIRAIAETGVDYISTGAITKHVHALDLSMRFMD
jgi:nicotinate-nucleotide pyrophosphorylase (carboxylating)